jgi:hypothetical protein
MELLDSLVNVLYALAELLAALAGAVAPLWPLLAWIAFWLLAVNWQKLRVALLGGGWIGVVLIGLVMVLVWGTLAPPDVQHSVFGLKLSNFVGKTVYVTGLLVLMLMCGSVQLSGLVDPYLNFAEPEPADHGHEPGHDQDGGHGNGHVGSHAHAH